MKTIICYIIWLAITTVFSICRDETKEAVLFRFIFTFIFFTIVLVLWRYVGNVLQHK